MNLNIDVVLNMAHTFANLQMVTGKIDTVYPH